MEEKKFVKKTDIIIIGVILLVAVAGIFFINSKKNVVSDDYNYILFTYKSEPKELFYLGDYEESVIVDLSEKYPVSGSIEFADHKARFVNVTCPDHICEAYGWISQESDIGAVCIPNLMSITVVSPEQAKEIMNELK